MKASVLAEVAPLFMEFFEICRNGVLPNIRLVDALKALHTQEAILHQSQNICTWAPSAGGCLRMIAGNFRECKMDAEARRRMFGKACVIVFSIGVSLGTHVFRVSLDCL
jgi:hypothetical protein